MARKVRCTTRSQGIHFATVGVVKDARTGRTLAETGVKPYQSSAAIIAAEALAEARGWQIVTGDEDA